MAIVAIVGIGWGEECDRKACAFFVHRAFPLRNDALKRKSERESGRGGCGACVIRLPIDSDVYVLRGTRSA